MGSECNWEERVFFYLSYIVLYGSCIVGAIGIPLLIIHMWLNAPLLICIVMSFIFLIGLLMCIAVARKN